MRIGEAAAAAGLTPRALRYYEQRELLTARRTSSGHREYSLADVHRLRIVRELLEAGLTVGDVRSLVQVLDMKLPPEGRGCGAVTGAHPDGCPVAEVTDRRLADLDRRIARLTEVRDRLADALAHQFEGLFQSLDRAHDRRPDQAA